jgi:hypothetical protein
MTSHRLSWLLVVLVTSTASAFTLPPKRAAVESYFDQLKAPVGELGGCAKQLVDFFAKANASATEQDGWDRLLCLEAIGLADSAESAAFAIAHLSAAAAIAVSGNASEASQEQFYALMENAAQIKLATLQHALAAIHKIESHTQNAALRLCVDRVCELSAQVAGSLQQLVDAKVVASRPTPGQGF